MIFGRHQRALSETAAAARSRRIGVVGIVAIVVALATTGVAYLNPTGQTGYAANAASSGGLRAGDQVRIAGVPVGKVTGVRLNRTLVEITFDVTRSVAVGAQSTVEIKLLTPLGGHYLALDPQGDLPLGHNVIPPQRVKSPYEGADMIQEVTPFLKEVDGQVIHDTFAEVANAADKYPNALRDLVRSATELTRVLGTMTGDVHRGLGFINDATAALVSGRRHFVELLEQFALVGQRYTAKSVDIVEFFTLLGELTRIIDRVMAFYHRELAPTLNGVDDIVDTLVSHPDRIGQAAAGLDQILRIVGPMLSGNGVVLDQSRRMVPGQDLCLPHIMRRC
ncbi:MCE family protein [Mycobacterium shinjukuense]|uniref:Putative Mce family protein n=1 Tax=Mycobacterium shinjukuense TaxID=398694 RepID=A0A7I7MV32_9MYCO|nr:MCE family protein [Mycobacterium shinjukuense]BBX75956.1 putative Mce family protein [Mycobacterium shinjukuense]